MTARRRAHGWHNATYAAEARAGGSAPGRGNPALTPAEARAVVAYVTADPSWTIGPVEVTFSGTSKGIGAGRGHAWYDRRAVNFNRVGISAALVLHELAHLTATDPDTRDGRGHGPEFRAALLDLTARWLPYYDRRLRSAFAYYQLETTR